MFYAALLSICTFATLVGIGSVWWVIRRGGPPPTASSAPITVLKPLCGIDDRLEANLETFFRQVYPEFELVFGVEGTADPALAVVDRLRRRFPNVPCRLVVHDGGRGINPKVSNLRAMLEAARHDLLVVSDSNVAVAPGYLSRMAAPMSDPSVGMVTSLFCGDGEACLGAALENLHLNGPVVAAVASSAAVAGRPVTVGKSLLFSRSEFERLGGFESVANLLAEDYVMGRMYREAGYAVRLAPEVVRNVCRHTTLRRFLMRHLRWGLIRFRLNPANALIEPLGNPMLLALLAPIFGVALGPAALWAVGLTLLRDSAQWILLRGPRGLVYAAPLGPFKDLLLIAIALAVPFVRHVSWRGKRFRLSAGTRLYARSPYPEPRLLVIS